MTNPGYGGGRDGQSRLFGQATMSGLTGGNWSRTSGSLEATIEVDGLRKRFGPTMASP